MALRSVLLALGLLALTACASERPSVQMEPVAPTATPIRLASPEFDEAEVVHLAKPASDDGQFFVSRFARDTLVQIHYQRPAATVSVKPTAPAVRTNCGSSWRMWTAANRRAEAAGRW